MAWGDHVRGSEMYSSPTPALESSPRGPLRGHRRWGVAALLMAVTVVNYLDRTCLAFAAPTLKQQLKIDEVDFSHIVMAFQITYMLMQPISGRIIDWLNIRIGMACAIAWWSMAQVLTAFCGGAAGFAALRSLLGVGEAANFPCAAKAVCQWFPPRERTVATGIINMGAGIGQMIAAPLVALLIVRWNWKAAFGATGLAGLALLVVWLSVYRDPEASCAISDEECGVAGSRPGKRPGGAERDVAADRRSVWTTVLGQRSFWGLATARFFSEPAWQLFSYWIPLYLATQRHLKLSQIALFGWVPFLAGDLGSLVGGAMSPLFMRFGASVLRARKLAAFSCAALMAFAIFIGSAPSAAWAVVFFCVGAFAHQAMSATLLTLPADLFPERAVATANGLSGTVGGLGGMLFTGVVGIVAQRGGYGPLFVAIALFDLIGSTILWATVEESPGAHAGVHARAKVTVGP